MVIIMVKLSEGTPFPLERTIQKTVHFDDVEFMGDVIGTTTAYNQFVYRVNPGVARTFAVLSSLCSAFEQYRFEALEFYLNPTATTLMSGTNVTTGWHGMTFVVQAGFPAFTNKSQFLQYYGSVSDKVSNPVHLVVDLRKIMGTNFLYVSQGSDYAQDERLTDLGLLTVAVGQQQASFQVSELWVKYHVQCKKVKPMSFLGNSNLFAFYKCTGSVSGTNFFGNTQTAQPGTNISLKFMNTPYTSAVTHAASLMIFPDRLLGTFMVTLYVVGTSGAWNWGLTGPSLNCTTIPTLLNGTGTTQTSSSGNGTVMTLTYYFQIDSEGNSYLDASSSSTCFAVPTSITMLSNVTDCEVIVQQVPQYVNDVNIDS